MNRPQQYMCMEHGQTYMGGKGCSKCRNRALLLTLFAGFCLGFLAGAWLL